MRIKPTYDPDFRLPADDNALVDSAAAMQFLQIARATLDRFAASAVLQRVKIGRSTRYRAGALRALASTGNSA